MSAKSGIWGLGLGKKQAAKTADKRSEQAEKPKQLPPYHVVLLNDNDHTYDYVIQLLGSLFAYSEQRGYELAKQVDKGGRAIVYTSHKELAELKREQIQHYGMDPRVASCRGSMSAIIELA